MSENERPAPELPAYSDDGVDLTLIRWMLYMTPAERLETLQYFANCVLKIRAAHAKD